MTQHAMGSTIARTKRHYMSCGLAAAVSVTNSKQLDHQRNARCSKHKVHAVPEELSESWKVDLASQEPQERSD